MPSVAVKPEPSRPEAGGWLGPALAIIAAVTAARVLAANEVLERLSMD